LPFTRDGRGYAQNTPFINLWNLHLLACMGSIFWRIEGLTGFFLGCGKVDEEFERRVKGSLSARQWCADFGRGLEKGMSTSLHFAFYHKGNLLPFQEIVLDPHPSVISLYCFQMLQANFPSAVMHTSQTKDADIDHAFASGSSSSRHF
jgi:hypothetical protein